MRQNSLDQLNVIINSKDYVLEARQAAKWELEYRQTHNSPSPPPGESGYQAFLEALEATEELAVGESYQEFLEVDIDNKSVLDIARKVFEKLQWKIIQIDDQAVLARRERPKHRFSEIASFLINPKGEVIVFSQTFSAPRFKNKTNRNAQAVKLAIHVFNEILKSKVT